MTFRFEHAVIGRVNGTYGKELRKEQRTYADDRSMESITNDAAACSHMTFRRQRRRAGLPPCY